MSRYLKYLQKCRLIPHTRPEKTDFEMKLFPVLSASTDKPLHRSQYIEEKTEQKQTTKKKTNTNIIGEKLLIIKNNVSRIHLNGAVIYHKLIVLALGRSV